MESFAQGVGEAGLGPWPDGHLALWPQLAGPNACPHPDLSLARRVMPCICAQLGPGLCRLVLQNRWAQAGGDEVAGSPQKKHARRCHRWSISVRVGCQLVETSCICLASRALISASRALQGKYLIKI